MARSHSTYQHQCGVGSQSVFTRLDRTILDHGRQFESQLWKNLSTLMDLEKHVPQRTIPRVMAWSSAFTGNSLVKRSTHVRRYVNPCDDGRGPTRSTWTISKRASGVGKVAIAAMECHWILACWHCKQARVHCRTSALMPGHTNRAVTSF